MSVEIVSGMLAIASSLVALLTAIFKINRMIITFEESLRRLDVFAQAQKKTNEIYEKRLRFCEEALKRSQKGENE